MLPVPFLLWACTVPAQRPPTDALVEVVVRLPPATVLVQGVEAKVEGLDDAELRYSWSVDGERVDWAEPTVPAALLQLGQRWTVTVQASVAGNTGVGTATTEVTQVGGNILLVLVDDLGVDKVGLYGVHPNVPPTPTLDTLAAEGVLFESVWVQPTCSPTRASILTGRYPRRTGIGRWIYPRTADIGLDPDAVILPELLDYARPSYRNAMLGKWHLSGFHSNPDPAIDPLLSGFDWFEGTLANPDNSLNPPATRPKGYRNWEKTSNGEQHFLTDYLTTVTTDDALHQLDVLPEPWFLYVAYNAPHKPLHVPPPHLQSSGLRRGEGTEKQRYDAMVEALDTELGRLLAGIEPAVRARTTVIFLSDNGTPKHAIRAPLDLHRSKGTLFEGGVRVPMIVTGPMVTHGGVRTAAMVESVDIFHTVAEIAGVDLSDVIDPRTGAAVVTDGLSFLPQLIDPDAWSARDRQYSSFHYPNGDDPITGGDALRSKDYKVARFLDGGWWFFSYASPFDEGPDLLQSGSLTEAEDAIYLQLRGELEARISELNPDFQ